MKDNRIAIVYLPGGGTQNFTTCKDVEDRTYKLVDSIEGEPDRLNIAYWEDGKVHGQSFVRMPYTLEIWK